MLPLIPVIARLKPLPPTQELRLHLPPTFTIQEMVEAVLRDPRFDAGLQPILHVFIGGNRLPRPLWAHTKVKHGQQVMVVPLYGRGETASKIGQLAVLGAQAFAMTIPGVGPFASALIGLGGSLLLQKLAGPPKTSSASGPNIGQLTSAGFSGNELRPYDQIPTAFGRIRHSPNLILPASTIFESESKIVRGILGVSGDVELSDIRANGMPIDDADGVEYEVVPGDGVTRSLALFDFIALTDIHNQLMSNYTIVADTDGDNASTLKSESSRPQWHSILTKDSPDEINIQLEFPSGITATYSPLYIHFRIRMRLKGETAWRNLPEIQMRPSKASLQITQRKLRIKWFGNERLGAEDTNQAGSAADGAFYFHADQGNTPHGPASWTSDAYFDDGSIGLNVNNQPAHVLGLATVQEADDDEPTPVADGIDFTIWLDVADWPQGKYELQIMRSAVTGNSESTGTSTGRWCNHAGGSGVRVDPFLYRIADVGPPIEYSISPAQGLATCDVVIHSITYKWFQEPFQFTDVAALAFKLTNATVEHVSAICEQHVQLPIGGQWIAKGPSRNAAAIMRHVLSKKPLNRRPIDASLLDDDFFTTWFEHCVANDLNCDGVVEDGSVEELIHSIARAGQAVIARSGRSWKVAIDKDRSAEAPTLVFSPRNTRNFTIERHFDDLTHAILATFLDEDDDWRQKQITVYGDGYGPHNAEDVREVHYDFICKQERVELEALRDLRKQRYRRNVVSFETNLAYLAIDKGDLVGVAQDILDGFYGWGYVTEVKRAGGFITGLTLDASVAIGSSTDAYIAITYLDGTATVEAPVLTNGKTRHLALSTPIADTALIDAGAHVSVNPLSTVYRRMIVEDIRPGPKRTAQVLCVDEAPEIFA